MKKLSTLHMAYADNICRIVVAVEIFIFQIDHITKPIKFKDLESRMLHEHSQNILI